MLVLVHRAAGWLYRAGLEAILGLRVLGNERHCACIPAGGAGRPYVGNTLYESRANPSGLRRISHVELDHLTMVAPIRIPLVDEWVTLPSVS